MASDSQQSPISKATQPIEITPGGGWPVIQYWAKATLTPQGPHLWKTLNHQSACLSCAWGTGGQAGGFVNEEGEILQRCAKSVEAIASELQPAISTTFWQQYSIAQLQQLTSQATNNLGRLTHPLILRAGQQHYERISWDEVYSIVTNSLQQPPERVASYSSGRSSNEAAFLLQLMLRALGSNNLADCSDLCHAASTVALRQMFGSGTSMVSLADLKLADCVVLIGSNAPANHPRLMNELIQLRDRGGKVIVINPIVESGLVKFSSPAYPVKSLLAGGTEISSLYLQPIPGSDVALFVGIQKALLAQNHVAFDFLQHYTEGWEAAIASANTTSWDSIIATSGISQAEIELAAQIIGQSQRVVFAWAMGVTQQVNGVENIYSIANTALLSGNIGKPGAGTMPIRGHSNVQGFGSMGVTVKLRQDLQAALEKLLNKPLSSVPGYDTRKLIEAADRGQIDTLLCLGGNLYGANPDTTQTQRALSQIDTLIYLATKPNPGHFHGLGQRQTLLLPVFARFENPDRTTTESGNNFVRFNEPGKTHLKNADLVSEVAFLAEVAHRLHGDRPIDWWQLQDTRYIRQLIAQVIPGYAAIAEIDETAIEFTIAGRIFHQPHFPTPSGKAQLFPTPLPQLQVPQLADFGRAGQARAIALVLGTGRSYGQHNTVVYHPADQYRNMPHRNCILLNHDDAESVGFKPGERVTVQGNVGQMTQVEVVYGEIRRGAAMMFYPEVNGIFSAPIDPSCGTPAFKRVPVVVYAP